MVTRRHRIGFPVFRSISSSRHADTITPADPLNAVAISFNGNGLPQKRGGSASAISLFEACSVFTRVSAYLVARSPEVTRYTRVLQQICYLLYRPGCFRPSDRLAGRDSHPLEIADFHGIHVMWDSTFTSGRSPPASWTAKDASWKHALSS